jgi:hypothetical protein
VGPRAPVQPGGEARTPTEGRAQRSRRRFRAHFEILRLTLAQAILHDLREAAA